MIICLTCGNKGRFYRRRDLRVWATDTAYINGKDEEAIEYDDYDEHDSECYHEEPITCQVCNSEDIEGGLSATEIKKLVWMHTDKKGEWCEKEVPKKERDDKLYLEICDVAL